MHREMEFWRMFVPREELTRVYMAMSIRSFAVSLTSLFVPLYLYSELHYTFEETLLFFVFNSLIFALMVPVAAKFCARFGLKHSVLLSVPFYLSYIVLLQFLPMWKTPLMVISALLGFSLAFYWMGMNLVFQCATDHAHRGEQVGKQMGYSIVATMIGPLVGGLIIERFGFMALFGLAMVFLCLSAGILFLSEERHVAYHFSLRGVVDRKHWGNSLYFVSKGTRIMAEGVIWPMAIFVILGGYVRLGIMGTVLSLVSAILVWVVGKYSDSFGKRGIIWLITGFESLAWFFRSIVGSVAMVFGVTIFAGVADGIREAPLGALECDKARGELASYYVVREIYISLGRMLILLFVLLVHNLQAGLLFQGFANLATLWF